jgi:hypothetical protein
MIQLTYFKDKKRENFFHKNKIIKKQRIIKDFFQHFSIKKYAINNFLLLLLLNFKRCVSFKFSRLKIFSKLFATKRFNLKSFNCNNNLIFNQTFSKRTWINKTLFSLNFLIFPLEKKVPNNIFLNFVFIKKKPKF